MFNGRIMSRKRPAESDHFNVGMKLLRLLVRSPRSLGVSEIAEAMEMAVSSAHDMLRVLGELGFIDRDEATRCYRASPLFFELMHEYANEFGATRKLRDTLDELSQQYKATLYLGTLWGRQSIIIAAAGTLGATYALGASGPAYATAIGRAMISRMPEDAWEEYAPGADDAPITDATIRDADAFYGILAEAHEKGVAWNIGETGGTVSVAAPIVEISQRCRYGVAFIFHEAEWVPHRRTHYAQTIRKCAEVLANRLVN